MARFAMAIDTKKCVGCMDCVVACKTENEIPVGFNRAWIVQDLKGKYPELSLEIRSERCNHCDNPPCVAACPTGASHVNDLGRVVVVEHNMCVGCKVCIAACPYDARYVHPDGYVDKCTFCIHRVEKGSDPACSEVCPAHAITFGDIEDPESEISKILSSRLSHRLLDEAGTKPQVYYLI
ncbi:MAG: 4Fe-4S dicluster domain-containing protein [Acidobacteriota bacterium]